MGNTIKKFKVNGKDYVIQNATATEAGLMDSSQYTVVLSLYGDTSTVTPVSADKISYVDSSLWHTTVSNVGQELDNMEYEILKSHAERGQHLVEITMTEGKGIVCDDSVVSLQSVRQDITFDNFTFDVDAFNSYVYQVEAGDSILIISGSIESTGQNLYTFYAQDGSIIAEATAYSAPNGVQATATQDGWVAVNTTPLGASMTLNGYKQDVTKYGKLVLNKSNLEFYSRVVDTTCFSEAVDREGYSCYITDVKNGDAFNIKTDGIGTEEYQTFAFYGVDKGVEADGVTVTASAKSLVYNVALDCVDIVAPCDGVLIVNLKNGSHLWKGRTLQEEVVEIESKLSEQIATEKNDVKRISLETGENLSKVALTSSKVIPNSESVFATYDTSIAIVSGNFTYDSSATYNSYVFQVKNGDDITISTGDISGCGQRLYTIYDSKGLINAQASSSFVSSTADSSIQIKTDGWVAINTTAVDSSVLYKTSKKVATKKGYYVENVDPIENWEFVLTPDNFSDPVDNDDYSCYISKVSKGDVYCVKSPYGGADPYRTYSFYTIDGSLGVVNTYTNSDLDYVNIEAPDDGVLIVNIKGDGELYKGSSLRSQVTDIQNTLDNIFNIDIFKLWTQDEYDNILSKKSTFYFVAKDASTRALKKVYRVYIGNMLFAENTDDSFSYSSKFPFKFSFKFI